MSKHSDPVTPTTAPVTHESPLARFPGSVTLPDMLSWPQVRAVEALLLERDADDDDRNVIQRNFELIATFAQFDLAFIDAAGTEHPPGAWALDRTGRTTPPGVARWVAKIGTPLLDEAWALPNSHALSRSGTSE